MQILAVRTARLIAYLNVEELNPEGRPLAHDYFNAFVERYSFIKRPMTPAEILDPEDKGITFELGKFGNFAITKVVLFDTAVAIETTATTDASEEILQDMLNWGAETFGLSNRPDLITRRAYVSEIVFFSKLDLKAINPTIQTLADKITGLVSGYMGNSLPFETTGINLAFDSTQSKQIYTPFSLHRLAETPFTQNKYYSAAPLQTSDHIQLINELEAALAFNGTAPVIEGKELFMTNNYTRAGEEAKQFFVRISTECDTLNAKIIEYADRVGRITKQGNPAEWDAIMKGSAADLKLFAEQIDQLLPDYRRNIDLLTEGFAERVKSLDPATDAEAQELEGMRREAQTLAETARGVKPKITALRGILETIRDSNHDHGLTQAVRRVISSTDTFFTAYDDLETFALKVSFSASRK